LGRHPRLAGHPVNPASVRDWLRSQGRRAKTDAQDARGLAAYVERASIPGAFALG